MEKDIICAKPFEIDWDKWISWNHLTKNACIIPNKPGVYEVKYNLCDKEVSVLLQNIMNTTSKRYSYYDEEIRLHIGLSGIGKDQKLCGRMKKMLGINKGNHSAGEKIRNDKNFRPCKIIVRWAVTDNGKIAEAVEKALMIRHFQKYGDIPIHDIKM